MECKTKDIKNMEKKSTRRAWTREDISYLTQHYGRKPIKEIAKELGRSELSARLYALHHRMIPEGTKTVKRNLLVELLKVRFRHLEDFTPSKYFYAECHISQFRYADIFYGRKQIKPEEYKAIAAYFDITAAEALESRQLELAFDDNE